MGPGRRALPCGTDAALVQAPGLLRKLWLWDEGQARQQAGAQHRVLEPGGQGGQGEGEETVLTCYARHTAPPPQALAAAAIPPGVDGSAP